MKCINHVASNTHPLLLDNFSPPPLIPIVHVSGGNSDILNLHVSMFTGCVPVNLTLLIGIFGAGTGWFVTLKH